MGGRDRHSQFDVYPADGGQVDVYPADALPVAATPSTGYTSDMVPIWYPGWLEMTAGVVGPNQGQLPPTSPLTLFSNGGEREREPGIRIFFRTLHLSASSKMTKFQGGLHFFLVSAYLIIVFITSMNIVHSLSKHSRVQSESAHEIELYSSRKSAVVGTQFF